MIGEARIEVLVLPVADADRSRDFYVDRLGFDLDVDYRPSEEFRVVQLTPVGSRCSIHLTETTGPIQPRHMHLMVADVAAAREELCAAGVEIEELRHKVPRDGWSGAWAPGPDPQRADYATAANFADPDGHVWTVQEYGHRPKSVAPTKDRRG